MSLKSLFLPWLVIRELEASADYDAATITYLASEVDRLAAEVAKMDADGDGYIGGSKPRPHQ